MKIVLTGALALAQLAALIIPLFGLTYFVREFGGDNDDGTFTMTAARRWKAVLVSAICLAIWAGQLCASLRALFRMWGKRPDAISSERKNR